MESVLACFIYSYADIYAALVERKKSQGCALIVNCLCFLWEPRAALLIPNVDTWWFSLKLVWDPFILVGQWKNLNEGVVLWSQCCLTSSISSYKWVDCTVHFWTVAGSPHFVLPQICWCKTSWLGCNYVFYIQKSKNRITCVFRW